MERVLGDVPAAGVEPRSRVLTMDVRPWTAGLVSSVVQVTVNTMSEQQHPQEPPRNDRQHEHDRHPDYDSDRRGEHKYPHEDDRPSQREHDALKERLERGR
jgi:hypothetical protein